MNNERITRVRERKGRVWENSSKIEVGVFGCLWEWFWWVCSFHSLTYHLQVCVGVFVCICLGLHVRSCNQDIWMSVWTFVEFLDWTCGDNSYTTITDAIRVLLFLVCSIFFWLCSLSREKMRGRQWEWDGFRSWTNRRTSKLSLNNSHFSKIRVFGDWLDLVPRN